MGRQKWVREAGEHLSEQTQHVLLSYYGCVSVFTVTLLFPGMGIRDGITRAAWRGGCGSPQPLQREQGLSKPNTASPAPSSMRLQGVHGNVKP